MPRPSSFKFFVPFNKAHIDKATNKMVVEGLASTTEVGLTGERMADSAIKSMAASNLVGYANPSRHHFRRAN